MELEARIEKTVGTFHLQAEFIVGDSILGIMGMSGSGKSMTLKCIAGIETPDRGRIVLNGRVLYDSEKRINLPPQKRKVGYLFQEYALFPHMTVRQNILAGMGKKSASQADGYLRRFGLEGLENQYPEQLSGGQKQRTALARMLAAEPEVILLDEPFAASDSHLRGKLIQEMREHLREAGCPAILVTHNREEVYRLCNKAVCLNAGQLEAVQSVTEFFRHPRTKTAALLSGCENVAEAQRLDDGRLYVPAWGIAISGKEIPEETAAVGIRADAFIWKNTEEAETGKEVQLSQRYICFPIEKYERMQEPFEQVLRFQCTGGSVFLESRMKNRDTETVSDEVPKCLLVHPEDILLLQK